MTVLNENITLDELLSLFKEGGNRNDVIKKIKELEPVHEDVKGLKLFLEENNWDYHKVEDFIAHSEASFPKVKQNNTEKKMNMRWLRVAAVIIPLIGIGSYFILTHYKNESELYANYYEKEVGLPVLMGSNNDKIFMESMNAFRDSEYEEALGGFSELLETKANNDTLLYFSACSNMELDNNSEATKQFKAVPDYSVFKEKSDYRLVLTYIKNEDFEKAKQKLIVIANAANHQYNSKAKKLLKEDVFN